MRSWILVLATCQVAFCAGTAAAMPSDTADIVVKSVRLTDNGDSDGFADPNETVNLFVTLRNVSDLDHTGIVAVLASPDPTVDCISTPALAFGPLLAGETRESGTPFTFRVADVARTDPVGELTATFDIHLSADGFGSVLRPQQVVLDLDLNVSGGFLPSAFSEGFEGGGFGAFTSMTLDVGLNSNALSDGLRCQYHDPDFVLSSSYGRQSCFVGLPSGNAYDWHVHGMGSPDGGRAYLGGQSLHWGMHTGVPSLDTSRLSQIDAIRTSVPVNLGWNGVTSELSFKHQAGLTSCLFHGGCYIGTGVEQSIDAGIVQLQLANSAGAGVGSWRKISPYENVYDGQGTWSFVNCTFDPTDDGNDEDGYFFPADPERQFGPSSTCYPEFVFSRMGGIFWNAAYDPGDIGAASDGPGLQGSLGPGTWVESKFSLDRWRGRRIRLRFLVTSIESESDVSMQQALGWNPTAADDGWYIDDVRVTNTLVSAATVAVDTSDRSGLPDCAPGCGVVTAALTATPSNPLPEEMTTLDASASFADQCQSGLHYRFWSDRFASGVYGDTGDTLLRDWSPDPVLIHLPAEQTTHYAVEVRCGFEPGCGGSAMTEVAFDCADLSPVPFPYRIVFWNASQLGFFYPDRADVVRGSLIALRAAGGNFEGTVETCLANDGLGSTLEDPALPGPGEGNYYLVREAGPAPPCSFHSWGAGTPQEVPGAGGDRDDDLEGDPQTCP